MDDFSPISHRPADWPDEGPQPELEPSEPTTLYVLPLGWSLSYALTKKLWADLRERHKALYPEWNHCACPKRCPAKPLDEKWTYDDASHTKTFLSAAFICNGCHWLKSPGFRMNSWTRPAPLTSEPPHIIHCLGWTQQQVDALRDRDLKKHKVETVLRTRLNQQVQQGRAAIVPAPPERLPPQELQRLVKPGQVMIVPWRVDLTALTQYGYSQSEIVVFEQRMYKLAAKRMAGNN